MVIDKTVGADFLAETGRGVEIRTLNDLRSGAENLVKDFYFEGLDVLQCYEGRHRIERRGRPVVYLEPGELLITYPGHWVTIDALEERNRLVYGIFTGEYVVDHFNALGCFDGLCGKVSVRHESIKKLCGLMKPELYKTTAGHDACIGYLSDLIVTVVCEVRSNGNALVFDAVRQIRKNLSEGIVRLQDLCEDLRVCRSYLHRVFRDEGLGCIAEFIKNEQLQLALQMLQNTNQTVAEIARASGFISATHFSTFVKKRVGRSPRELRRKSGDATVSLQKQIKKTKTN